MTRDRIAISVVVAAAVVAGFWFAILAPKRQDVSQADAALATQRDRLDRAQATAAKARAARASYNADYSAVVMLGTAVPAQDGLPSLLSQIDGSASRAKVDFSSITSGTGPAATATPGSAGASTPTPATGTATGTSSATAPTPVPLSFVFSGSFPDMEHMLGSVHDFVRPSGSGVAVSGRLLSVDDISLQPSSGDLAHVQATVSATAYTMPAPTTPAAGTAAGTAAPASATATTTTTTASGTTP